MALFRKMSVSCDGHYRGEAYVNPDERWNGWLLPYFPKDQAEKVLDALVDDGSNSEIDEWHYSEGEDRFYYHDTNVDVDDWAEGVLVETEDGQQIGYPVGAGVYIWSED